MRRSAASAELTRQVAKSTPAACERANEDDAQLVFFPFLSISRGALHFGILGPSIHVGLVLSQHLVIAG